MTPAFRLAGWLFLVASAAGSAVLYDGSASGFTLQNGFVFVRFSSSSSGLTELSADFSGSGNFPTSSNILSLPFTLESQDVSGILDEVAKPCTSRDGSKTVTIKVLTNTPARVEVEVSGLTDCSAGQYCDVR